MKYIFIVNGAAGSRKNNPYLPYIEAVCQDLQLSYQIAYTTKPHDATDFAANYSATDAVIVSVGGDGTAFEVLNGLKEQTAMAVLPCGTGNDYYRMIAPYPTDYKKTLIDTVKGRLVKVDYGISDSCKFLNGTSFGIDASVNRMVCEKLKHSIVPRSIAYAVSAISNVFHPQTIKLSLQADDTKVEMKACLCAIMNGGYYGNGVCPTSRANIQDGLFEICAVEAATTGQLIKILPAYMKGNGEQIKTAHFYRAKDIEVSCDHDVDIQSDGELFGGSHMHFSIAPAALPLLVPDYSKLR